jgi:hypothetical protein
MTILRWIGLAIGLGLFVFSFFLARKGRARGVDRIIGMLAGLGLAAVSIFPETITIVRDLLSLDRDQFSRIIALGIISNIMLWILIVYYRARWAAQSDDFELLVRRLAVREFEERYPDHDPLPEIVVLIPAYNEEANITHVLEQMPESVCGKPVAVIVIDDGSDDHTVERVRRAGHLAIRSPINRGGGAALHVGFEIAQRFGAKIVVTMDADGQHLPADIEGLVEPIIGDELDFVIGSRILGQREKDSAVRYLGIHFFNRIIRVLTPIKVTDCSNGYRALRVSSLSKLVLKQTQYHTPEVIIEASRKGARIGEAPVTVKRRLSGKSKKGRDLKYAFAFARSIIKTWLR